MNIELQAKGTAQERIRQYLVENASELLADKINNGTPLTKDGKQLVNKKNLDGFMRYAISQAKEQAEKGATGACIEDKVVFGWAMHYFEEDSIEGTLYNQDGSEYTPPRPAPKAKTTTTTITPPAPKPNPQMSLLDLMQADTVKVNQEKAKVDKQTGEVLQSVAKGNALFQKYKAYKDKYPDAVVAMRIGDFYEVFGKSAVSIAERLELTLTSRDMGLDTRMPMVGFPYHAAENYFSKIQEEYSLAVVETDESVRQLPKLEDDLTEEEMQEFDGDVVEPTDTESDDSPLFKLFGNVLIER